MKNDAATENLDKNIETVLGNLLRIGVIIAGIVVIIGAVLFLIRHGNEFPAYHLFKAVPFNFSEIGSLFNGVLSLKSIPIIELGVLLLIATPVLRVVFSVFAFVYEKDYMYVVFTLIVLFVLIISFFS